MKKILVIASMFFFGLPALSVSAKPSVAAATAHRELSKLIDQPVDINVADAEQLAQLKGIGPKKAGAIVNYRQEHGSFKSLQDLEHVPGFGKKSLAKMLEANPNRLIVHSVK